MRHAGQMSWRNTFAAHRYPNYKPWFMGQLASLVGTWMQTTARAELRAVEEEVDQAAADMWGLTAQELADGRASLRELKGAAASEKGA